MLGVLTALVTATACGGSSSSHTAAAATPPPAPVASIDATPARLSVAQLPDSAVEGWKLLAPARTQAVAGGIQLNECASVAGATSWQQQAYISVYRTPAEQDVFTFHDAPAAKAAYQDLLARMGACQSQSRALQAKSHLADDATVAATATTAQGTAWSRKWTGVEGISAAGPQTNHLYAVQQGASLAIVHFDEWAGTQAAPYDTRADQDVLTAVAGQLG
ncbi:MULTISPECIES: hypothetical protein [unclassified Kitasatospora]|uniref:hypothetical protein n=1 Tax=unclassified Kitasatospora TaxID=2633591 RepID=UPI0024767F7C|nr:hypothetical protein [Kitasatospora sp. MAP12-44]